MAASDENVGVSKQIIYGGKGECPKFEKNTKVTFHFRTISPSDSTNEETVIDDSRTMGCGPFELLYGRGFKLAIWERIVQTMKVSEVARFTCKKELVRYYVLVSKSLRDVAKQNRGEKVEPLSSHRCGAALLGCHGHQSTGYEDLDHLQEHSSDLVFEIELLSVENEGSYEKGIWSMNSDEKRDLIPKLKEQGNELYKNGQYLEAAAKYGTAIGCIEILESFEAPGSDPEKALYQMKEPLLLNYAQCKLHLGEYSNAIKQTTTVLRRSPNNVKALFRRGKAYALSLKAREAKVDLEKVVQLDSSLSQSVTKLLHDLDIEQKKQDKDDRALLQGKGFFK